MFKKVLGTAVMLLVLMGSVRAEERTTSDPPAHLGVVMYLVGKRHCNFNLDRHADLWAFNESPRYPIMRTVDLVIDAELMRAVEGTDKFCIRIETEFPTLRTPGHPRGGGGGWSWASGRRNSPSRPSRISSANAVASSTTRTAISRLTPGRG